ncbi:MAG: hypothetical protein ABI330_20335 [Caldimonas sp.]|nr:hypothetical protein [Pseudomonadota bacterium]MDQ2927115.1 hypothetical protein [Pseudomonadota bacterium]
MNLIAAVRWLLALTSRRAPRRRGSDPADMGTAFGLDAITTLEAELDSGLREAHPAPERSRFELRSRRRSGL